MCVEQFIFLTIQLKFGIFAFDCYLIYGMKMEVALRAFHSQFPGRAFRSRSAVVAVGRAASFSLVFSANECNGIYLPQHRGRGLLGPSTMAFLLAPVPIIII